jgi:hypothetical protein
MTPCPDCDRLREAMESAAKTLEAWMRDAEEMHRLAPGKGHDVTAYAYEVQVRAMRHALSAPPQAKEGKCPHGGNFSPASGMCAGDCQPKGEGR